MKKWLGAAFLFAVGLTACGGGGDGGSPAPTAKAVKVSMYGNPIVSASSSAVASAKFSVISAAVAADAPSVASDAQATVKSLQDALAERGVTADVTPQVMNGTSLHTLIMSENNGQPPTPDQFTKDIMSGDYVVANFQLDDMVTPWNDPAQQAAAAQFKQDLKVFIQRMHVAGRQVWSVLPIQTCDYPPGVQPFSGTYTASDALSWAIEQASNEAGGQVTGGIPTNTVTTWDPATNKYVTVSTVTQGHLGADCRTPDAYLRNMQIDSIADTIAQIYREEAVPASGASTASPASGASGT